MIITVEVELQTEGHCDVHDITARLNAEIANSGIVEGQVLVFVSGSTAGVTTVEFEPGLVLDIQEFFEKLIPERGNFHHHKTWGDDNGSSHVRAALLKPSLTIPFRQGLLLLGTWQQVVIVDFDTRPRTRKTVIQITGEAGSYEVKSSNRPS